MDTAYYRLLKKQFPSKEAVLTEIINLSAICELPKGTEHFVSDVHGEYAAFNHTLRNGSGFIKEKIRDCFPSIGPDELKELSTLIYYPAEKVALILEENKTDEARLKRWYQATFQQLLQIARLAGKKYTQSKIRKATPENFRYVIDELLHEDAESPDKAAYVAAILQTMIELEQAPQLIITLADLIRRLSVDHLHMVGDIYDRGPYPDLIVERLMALPSVDIQWGNHDIIWMAIAAGSPLCMVNVLRICARYGNLDILEERYGVQLRPLIAYAEKYYKPSPAFQPRLLEQEEEKISEREKRLLNCLQQATMILQLKLEAQLIARRPELHLEHRDVLHAIDYEAQSITLAGKSYPLVDFQAPTVNPHEPSDLAAEETALIKHLLHSMQASEKLQRHMDFLIERGGMYLCYNDNLLIHGCLPLHENGDFESLKIGQQAYSGKDLLDFFDEQVRKSYKHPEISDDLATDLLWYLWVGPCSPLFGKHSMTTFERYYIADKSTHIEKKNPYYTLRDSVEVVKDILKVFGLPKNGHIINGHTPVHFKSGENPIKADGRLIVIDGGFSKPYQKETGIAGYTLLYNSYGIQLAAHQPFTGIENALQTGEDIVSVKRIVENAPSRRKVRDTTIGHQLLESIRELEHLFKHYAEY